jgi:hypothetical protein
MRRRVLTRLAVVLLLSVAVLLVGLSWLDQKVMTSWLQKTNELEEIAKRLDGRDIAAVLLELGQPSHISSEPAVRALPPRLRLTYIYQFRTLPWSVPQEAILHLHVELRSGTVQDTGVSQTYN